jgi:hypothetical protein
MGQSERRFSVTVPPISRDAWLECLAAMTMIGGHVETEPALIDLLKKVAISSEGYPASADTPDWPSKIWRMHWARFAFLLGSFHPQNVDAGGGSRRDAERSIVMESLWSARENGAMGRHQDLVHMFRVPSAQQLSNFRRGFSVSKIERTHDVKRGFVTVVRDPFHSRMSCAIYDEFIVRVGGYSFNGEPLADNHSAIVDSMDTYHKVIAAGLLITGEVSQENSIL